MASRTGIGGQRQSDEGRRAASNQGQGLSDTSSTWRARGCWRRRGCPSDGQCTLSMMLSWGLTHLPIQQHVGKLLLAGVGGGSPP